MFWWEWKFPEDNFFYNISGFRAENVMTFSEVTFCTVVKFAFCISRGPFLYVFFTIFILTPLKYLSNNFVEFWSKKFETIFKLHSTCTDEYFERKLVFEKQLLHVLSFLELNKKKLPGFWRRKFGTVVETNLYVYRGSFWGQKSLEQNKISIECFGMGTSSCPKLQRTSDTFVKTAFYLCNWSFWTESKFSQKTVFYHFRNKGRKIFDFRQSLLCTVGKTAFCVCRGHFWYVFWTLFISWTFLISEQEIFGSSTQKSWLCFFQNSILRVKTIFLSKKL